jgi:TolB-like protein
MSDDRKQEYFADGISEDIITALSRFRWFFVIARNSSFAFKGRAVDVKQVARELGVQYVLEGSVRKSTQRVRITAQLIDASTGTHIWAERFELELKDIFSVQDDITERVVGVIEPELLKRESLRATARGAGHLSAWDLVRQGTWHFHHATRSKFLRARELFREAISIDPQLPEAHMWLGRVNSSLVGWDFSEDQAADQREAVQSSLRGVQLDEKDPFGHFALALSYHYSGAIEQAMQAAEKSVQVCPTFALGHLALGMARLYGGDAAGATGPLERGLRMNPFDPLNFHWFRSLSLAFYFAGKPAEGLSAAVRSSQVRPAWRPALEAIIVCLVGLGRLDEARGRADHMKSLTEPDNDGLQQLRLRHPRWAQDMAAALREAGVSG